MYVLGLQRVKRWREFILVSLILLCVLPAFGQAEKENPGIFHWEFSLGGVSYYVSSANNWNFGPELTIQYAFANTYGIYVTVAYPTLRMTSRGYGFREGLPFDGGIWISSRSMKSPFKLGLGLSYIFGSDSDGSDVKGFGPHISTQASYWFTRHVGIWGRGVLRFWLGEHRHDSQFSPSFSAGLGFRFCHKNR